MKIYSPLRRFVMSAVSVLTALSLLTVTLLYEEGFYTLFAAAANSDVSDLQDEYADMEDELNHLKDELKDLQKAEAGYIDKVSNYNQQIDIVEEQIESVDEQIALLDDSVAETELRIEDIDMQIQELDASIGENYEKFKERLKAFHLNGEAGELEILLGSASIVDFLNRYSVMKAVAARDKALMDDLSDELSSMKQMRNEAEQLKSDLEKEIEETEKLKKELRAKQKELDKIKDETQDLLDDIRSDEEKTQDAIEELNRDLAKLEEEIEEAIRNSTGDFVGGEYLWPCPEYTRISSPFGYRTHPITGEKNKLHKGTDMVSAKNTPILAANSGKVTHAYDYVNGGYGKYIIIDHGGGIVTLYAHCNKVLVKKGDVVTKGQQIAKVGTTGNSTGYHLHFEIRIQNEAVDPMDYFPGYD